MSRNGRDHTRRFADLAAAISKLSPRTLVLDGEVAIYDQQLRSRFDWLREPDPAAVATPPLFMAFDLLYHEGRDLTVRPLCDRRARLEDVVAGSELVFAVRRLAPNGLEAWKQGGRARVRGLRRQGRGQRVRGRADEAVGEGQAEGLGRSPRTAGGVGSPLADRGSRTTGRCVRLLAVSLLTDLNASITAIRRSES